jgi:hypothetical protein
MNPASYLEMAETESRHWCFPGRRAILSGMIECLDFPQNFKILEVGCCTISDLLLGLTEYFVFYNTERTHQSLGYSTSYDGYHTTSRRRARIVDNSMRQKNAHRDRSNKGAAPFCCL